MSTFKNCIFATIGLLLLCLALSTTGIHQAIADKLDSVMVINGSNQPIPMRDVDRVQRQPFQHEVRFTTPDGFSEFTEQFVVPAGKRLIIEYFSATTTTGAGQVIRFYSLRTTANGVFVFHTVGATFNNFSDYVASQPIHVVADPGSAVQLSAPRSTAVGDVLTVAAISGFLQDV